MEVLIQLSLGFFVILLILRIYLTKNFDYWKKRKVPGPKPVPFFGTLKNVLLGNISVADNVKLVYDAYPGEPAIGLFYNSVPTLLVKDPRMIQDVLVKSFSSFPNRGIKIHPEVAMLSQNLIFFEYENWKPLRRKLTTSFASSKLKKMFYLIEECADHLVGNLCESVSKEEIVECLELSTNYMTSVAGTCAFGVHMNLATDVESEFHKFTQHVLKKTWDGQLRKLSRSLPRWVALVLMPFIKDKSSINFFEDLIASSMDYRQKYNIRRHDFIDLFMDIQGHDDQVGKEDILWTDQAFTFIAAGLEASSMTMTNAMYELALHPDIQDKLREEIKIACEENDGKLNCDVLKNMKYLDKIVHETLRKYPPAPLMMREALNDHTFSDSNISITKGTKICIPVYAVHHDPDIYPDPEKFDPERFEEQVIRSQPHMTYLAFGAGPRTCIGERFGLYQTKMGVANVVKNFRLEVCEKTDMNYEKRPGAFVTRPKDGLYLRIKKL